MKIIHVSVLILLIFQSMLFAQNRDEWQQPERILDSLNIQPGMVIGEVGAGSGYFTFKLADRLKGEGFIYANDIDKSALKKIERYCQDKRINNVKTIVGAENDPLFPADSLDLVIMVYVFHHLQNHQLFLQNLAKYVKPGKPVVIIERDPDRFGNYGHFMKKDAILEKIQSAKYTIRKIYTFLERDNIYLCDPPVSEN